MCSFSLLFHMFLFCMCCRQGFTDNDDSKKCCSGPHLSSLPCQPSLPENCNTICPHGSKFYGCSRSATGDCQATCQCCCSDECNVEAECHVFQSISTICMALSLERCECNGNSTVCKPTCQRIPVTDAPSFQYNYEDYYAENIEEPVVDDEIVIPNSSNPYGIFDEIIATDD